ncbi:uncharacterized protein ASCRUDRAFT_71486 [Ascoidea rubescens DSM 1968]|uniref:Uncharacterized protein n=1 Tax=Ascoidea rubescens DSM 1968 TaxID=1344418 RepID=A0A1D2VD10_9ASCO|nr:hypothetical protein ASCRUDRAFT_71486 [Ascoidea rubescens DSM 1968]ODV59521.1 hypothetical protein ASCRUDRAFT_71486 [Ascoidea rubescens DSM 1968]
MNSKNNNLNRIFQSINNQNYFEKNDKLLLYLYTGYWRRLRFKKRTINVYRKRNLPLYSDSSEIKLRKINNLKLRKVIDNKIPALDRRLDRYIDIKIRLTISQNCISVNDKRKGIQSQIINEKILFLNESDNKQKYMLFGKKYDENDLEQNHLGFYNLNKARENMDLGLRPRKHRFIRIVRSPFVSSSKEIEWDISRRCNAL